MANEENLRGPFTPSEAREFGRKGGKASGEARKEKKLIRERILERMTETDWDEYIDGIIRRSKEGDRSAEILRDTIGEKPIEQVNIMNIDKSQERLEELLKDDNV